MTELPCFESIGCKFSDSNIKSWILLRYLWCVFFCWEGLSSLLTCLSVLVCDHILVKNVYPILTTEKWLIV